MGLIVAMFSNPAKPRGIALVIVLWGLVLLAVIAAAFTTETRTEVTLARNLVENAKAKLVAKGCDWIVANNVSAETGILGGDDNTVHLIIGSDVESWPKMSKQAVAEQLATRIRDHLTGPP